MPDNVFIDYYRCPKHFRVPLPFDADDVIGNLRFERYMTGRSPDNLMQTIVRKIYYGLRPLMGVAFRKHLQRTYLRGWQDITFPHWPVDRSVECIFESVAALALELRDVDEMPFLWFWPDTYSGCAIVTHDVETAAGRDFAAQLADIDLSFGFRSSFQIVPEERYEVTESFLDCLRSRGCEINIHGLNHDGRLFESRKTFLEQLAKINRYARKYGAAGFRSPVLYRNLDWYGELEFSYDMSVPNCAHLDPQRGGCCTVMPYFIGDMVELPLTMTQDYSLFHLLHENSIDLWKRQIELVLEKHGLISFNVHPDYVIEEPYRSTYCELLEHLGKICADRNVWIALPQEVNDWWRQRRECNVMTARARMDRSGLVYDVVHAGDSALRRTEWHPPRACEYA